MHVKVEQVEKRLEGLECDVSRSARGVELLCEFVASANSSPGAQPKNLQDRLASYTGVITDESAAAPAAAPSLPWAGPSSTPPATGYLMSALVGRPPAAP